MDNRPNFNYISINPLKTEIEVMWHYTTFYRKKENGRIACYIPSFDIHFTADNIDACREKSNGLTAIFFDHFLESGIKNGMKQLVLNLHRLGFRSIQDSMVMKDFAHNKVIKAKFTGNIPSIPYGFSENQKIESQSKLAMAV